MSLARERLKKDGSYEERQISPDSFAKKRWVSVESVLTKLP